MTRSEESRDGSSIGAAPFAQILLRFVNEPIKPAGLDIGFKLPVPFFGVELSKPGEKSGSFFTAESPDGVFDLYLITTVIGSKLGERGDCGFVMRLHDLFEWDEAKAAKNLKKHGVSSDDVALVLADQEGDFYQIDEFDAVQSDDEDRYTTTASHPDDRRIVLRITWTDRSARRQRITRIISARFATSIERKNYAKEVGNK